MADKYQTALSSFQENNFTMAESLLEEIVTERADLNSLYFLAVVKSKLGNYKEAIELYNTVLRNQPNHLEAHFNKALCHQHLGENEKAVFHYKRALELNPNLIDAHNNIAIIYRNSGNMNMAEKHAAEVFSHSVGELSSQMSGLRTIQLDNKSIEELKEVIRLSNNKEYEKAKKILLGIKEQYGDIPDILNALGNVYFHLNEFENALETFKKFLSSDEGNATAYYSVGLCLQQLGQKEEALKYYLKSIELKPDYTDALNNAGLYYYGIKDFETASVYFRKALEVDPNHVKAIVNLGSTKTFADEYDEALKTFSLAEQIARQNDDIQLRGLIKANIGFCKLRMGKLDEALSYFNNAIEIDSGNILAHYNKAETLLKLGNFEEGWKEYEWRKKREEFGKRKFFQPLNLNADLNGKRILVYGEQGLGDTLQFVRYLKFLKERNAYVILECDPLLHELLANCDYIDELSVKTSLEKSPLAYDYDVSLLSLPLLFGTTLENIPSETPYLYWDEQKAESWAKYFGSKKFKVGLVWAGSPRHQNDRNRSVKLSELSFLFETEDVEFFSLQKGEALKQIEKFKDKIKNLDEFGIKNFADTAGIMKHLDLVITVDTSVAHLAGALGKEVWVLIPFNSDWRWLQDGNNSPWYSTMKLYRQKQPKEWQPVFESLKKDLTAKIKNRFKIQKNDSNLIMLVQALKKFNNDYSETANVATIISEILREELSGLISKRETLKTLDVGCIGMDLFKINGLDVTGITNNVQKLNQLKSKGFKVFESDQNFTGFNNSEFDLIFSYRTLEKSLSPIVTLEEFKRILKPGGILYVRTKTFGGNGEISTNEFYLLPQKLWIEFFNRTGFEILYSESTESRNGNIRKDLTFILKKKEVEISITKNETPKLNLALTHGENFGWGVCSNYLKKELAKKIEVVDLDADNIPNSQKQIEGKVFHALKNGSFEPLHPVWGKENYGYTFFENELNPLEVKNSKMYNKIFAGSSWCEQKMNEKGIANTGLLIQGVDTSLFYPVEKTDKRDLFVIFSGGKFELRKGQDLVLKAVKILQDKYPDIILINAWYNMWPATMQNMVLSKHIKFQAEGENWEEIMNNLYAVNGLNPNRIFTLPLIPNNNLRELYKNTDLGLFPNRCEGGTNLVLMEYMACAKPVIASFNTGHKDVLTDENSLPLKEMMEFKIFDDKNNLISDWEEPSMDEIISKVEWAYFHREEIKQIGERAGKDMLNFTWEKSAENLIQQIFGG